MTWRTKNGDQSVEIEIPNQSSTDFDFPLNSPTANTKDAPESGLDYHYQNQKATLADREIASTFSGTPNPQDEANRTEIERSLGLKRSDELPNMDESYLAKIDVVKQLFAAGRNEAALIELDHLVKIYPTNARVYEMRGTVLDRLGYTELAIRSWKQALEFEPNKLTLKRMIERKSQQQQRGVASESK